MADVEIQIINEIFKDSKITTEKDMFILHNLARIYGNDQHADKIIDIIFTLKKAGFTNLEFHDFLIDGIYPQSGGNIKYAGLS